MILKNALRSGPPLFETVCLQICSLEFAQTPANSFPEIGHSPSFNQSVSSSSEKQLKITLVRPCCFPRLTQLLVSQSDQRTWISSSIFLLKLGLSTWVIHIRLVCSLKFLNFSIRHMINKAMQPVCTRLVLFFFFL